MSRARIPFAIANFDGKEIKALKGALANFLSGGGEYTGKCNQWLSTYSQAPHVLLTQSCTAALEMAALLIDLKPGDEVIIPSFTFSSTANAVVLRGAVPVFVDVREDTLNMDEGLIEAAITKKTRAIMPVHYAGVACVMDEIMNMARAHKLDVIEDAAQGMMSTYKGKPLGTFGRLGAVSFHHSKNLMSGEGGALFINDPKLIARAEILWEKGTDRSRLLRGEIDKYTWRDVGSSFLPSELTASLLWTQLTRAKQITQARMKIWNRYHVAFEGLEKLGRVTRPFVPAECRANGHIYYLLLKDERARDRLIAKMKKKGIELYFHYVPLHSAPAGKKFGRSSGKLRVTDSIAARLVRLPIYPDLKPAQQEKVIRGILDELG